MRFDVLMVDAVAAALLYGLTGILLFFRTVRAGIKCVLLWRRWYAAEAAFCENRPRCSKCRLL